MEYSALDDFLKGLDIHDTHKTSKGEHSKHFQKHKSSDIFMDQSPKAKDIKKINKWDPIKLTKPNQTFLLHSKREIINEMKNNPHNRENI